MNPANPRRIAHLDAGQQHPIQGNEHRDLNHDREAAAHGVDLFLAVDPHHLLLHFLRIVFQAFTHFHDLGVDGFHFGHAGIGLGIEPVERNFDQQHQGDDGPTPVVEHAVQLVQQPIQRLGQHGQPAVVLHQVKARRQGFQHFFFLRPTVELVAQRFGLARRQIGKGRDHAYGIEVGVDLAHKIFTRYAIGQQPSTGKVVLNHGHIAVGGCLVDFGLVLFDVTELEFLVFFGIGVDGRSGEREIERRFAFRLVAVTHQLHVQQRRHAGLTVVHHLVLDIDHVAAALEGVGLDELDAIHFSRFESQNQFFLTRFEAALAAEGHGCFVGRKITPDQAGLCQIHTAGALVKQDHLLFRVNQVAVLGEFRTHQRAAF